MNSDPGPEMQLLVQADVDGELSPAEAARVAAHLQSCTACAALPERLTRLSDGLHRVSYYAAPDDLRAAITAKVSARADVGVPRGRLRMAAPFGAGFALAAMLLIVLLPRGGQVPDEIAAGHIRALQPGHLTDIVSTDQHTVKPWFDGRIDFAPPVRDLKEQGFPLEGARLDYLAGRAVAVLVYKRRQHVIDVFVWPDSGGAEASQTSRSGYNMVRWTAGGMSFWAVSDLEAKELVQFAESLRTN